MLENYERIFNSPDSKMKTDESWQRYMNPTDPKDTTPQRYRYSVGWLYGNVLDIGAGDGYGAYLMSKNKKIDHITCVEIQDKAIAKMRQNLTGIPNIRIIKTCAENILIQGRFDSIHCGHTLEYVLDEKAALENIERYARDIVVLSVLINGGISSVHLREFKNVGEFRRLVRKYFDEIEIRVFPKNNKVSSVVVIARARI